MADIKEILELVNSNDISDIRIGLEELGETRSTEYIDIFYSNLLSGNVSIREVCVDYFVKLLDPDVYPRMIKLLSLEDVPLRNAASEILTKTSHIAPEVITTYLWEYDDDVNKFLLDTLNDNSSLMCVDPAACEIISQGMSSENENIVGVVVELLTKFGNEAIWEDLITDSLTADGWVQYSILTSAKLHNPRVIKRFFEVVPQANISEEALIFLDIWNRGEAS